MYRNIRYKHLLLPFILVCCGFYFFYAVFKDLEIEAVKQLNKEQLVHAVQASKSISDFFNNYQIKLDFFADEPFIISLNDDGKRLLKHFYIRNSKYISAVTCIDSSGKIIFSTPYNDKTIGKDISYQEHIKKLLETHKPVLSDVFMAVQGFKSIAFYVPIYKGTKFTGGLAVLVRFDEITRNSLKEISVKQSGFAWLINQEGIILYHPKKESIGKSSFDELKYSTPALEMLKKAVSGKAGILSYKNETNNSIEAFYYPVNILDKHWSIIVNTPRIEILKDMEGLLLKWLIISGILLIGLIFFSLNINKARTILREEAERKKAAKAIAGSEKKFRTLVEVSPDSIILTDQYGYILVCNQKTAAILQYANSNELIGKNFTELFIQQDRMHAKELLEKTIENSATYNQELALTQNNSSPLTVEINTALLLDDLEQPLAVVAILRDITERKKTHEALTKAKEEAEKSDRLKSEFLAQMSHEIRSPINTVLSYTSLLNDEVHNLISDDLRTSFSAIENAGKRIVRTIDMILNMSEIQIGTYEPFFRKINLGKEILEKLFLEFAQTAKDKNLMLMYKNNLDKKDIFIKADEYTISQIFDNLINNAIKYTEKGYVKIIVDKSVDDTLFVEIKDTGIGISDEFIPELFKPFGQEEQGYTRRYEGNGLGLALVRKYCDINNLDIKVESKKGKGSSFTICFKHSHLCD